MQNVGIGDVLFIFLVLGVIHGIMHLVMLARKRKSQAEDDSGSQKG
jgi:F0F1-type ATP synthase assembly protein I